MKLRWLFPSIALSLLVGGCAPAVKSTASNAVVKVHGPDECAACHLPQTQDYHRTGHARTLARAGGAEFLERFAEQTVALQFDQRTQPTQLTHRNGQVYVSTEQFEPGIPIEWVFGSGHHAQTPVTTRFNSASNMVEALQFFATWYPEQGIGLTPGLGGNLGDRDVATIGLPTDPMGTFRCFVCHSSDLKLTGESLQVDQIVPGVLCSRCHDGLEQHLAKPTDVPRRWSRATAEEAVRDCARCHRTESSVLVAMAPQAESNTARFAPVGILKSACFLRQSPSQRFDCATCHDPHQPLSRSPEFYDARCASCHQPGKLPDECHNSAWTSSCVACHMPAIATQGVMHFTEHWIRRPISKPAEHR